MVRTGTQLYTLRNVEKPFMDVLETVADAGFEGVEFAYRVPDEDPEEVRATLDEAGVAVAGALPAVEIRTSRSPIVSVSGLSS